MRYTVTWRRKILLPLALLLFILPWHLPFPSHNHLGVLLFHHFPNYLFSKINLSRIILATTSTPLVLIDVPSSTSPLTSPILSTSSTPHTTPTSPHSDFPQLDIPSIFTISYLEIAITIPTYIPSSLAPFYSTPPILVSPLSVKIPISQTQPEPQVIVQEGTISTT